jgi:tetratricopeptide (TPR) repeat protein
VLVLAVLALAASGCRRDFLGGKTAVKAARQSVLTYPFSDPDPVPIFARGSMWGRGERLYPYFFFDGFAARGEARDWTVVTLENPVIKVAVLPEVGGKVWGATDKKTGREFLYWNHVLKFRQIALRGPWTSGGIEFNFGIVGHSPATATPVDYVVRRDRDGGGSCTVGALDLPSRTRWSVTVRLPAEAAFFETKAAWHNLTPYGQSYYYWSCPAVKASADLKYIFPGRWFIGHDYSVPLETWPVDGRGRDLSWHRNNAFGGSKSYFTVGDLADFYGAWYENDDAGFGHWARYDEMPGRKIWIWDLSRAGEIWVDLLTDSDGQYSEPQAGRLLNQSDHGEFPPGASDAWRELWFPYSDIGPMVAASPHAVLGAKKADDDIVLGVHALQALEEDLDVLTEGEKVFSARLSLRPGESWKRAVELPGGAQTSFEVRVGTKLRYISDPSADDLGRPFRFRENRGGSAQQLYMDANRLERERSYREALEKYLQCLAQEPEHVGALARVAQLFTRRGEPEKAIHYAGRALEASMYDPDANYAYGLAALGLGRLNDAEEALGWAARSPFYGSVALSRMAEIAIIKKDIARALEYARKACSAGPSNAAAGEVLAVACRLAGRKKEARDLLDKMLESDPLDHLARFELCLLSRKPRDLEAFRSLIRGELPHETYLEIAAFYARLGLVEEAVAVLENGPEHPTVLYWLAYLLRDRDRARSGALLDKASAASPYFVFPHREESIPVFNWAARMKPEDWKPRYYLGLIYWAKGRLDEAKAELVSCESADFWPLYISRALLLERTNLEGAETDLRRAVEVGPRSWRTRHALTAFYLRTGQTDLALQAAEDGVAAVPEQGPLRVDLIKALIARGRHEEAAAAIDTLEVLPYEGATEVHGLYVSAHTGLALKNMLEGKWQAALGCFEKARQYPERLGTGRPFEPDQRLQDYLSAVCLARLGDIAGADRLRQAVLDYTIEHLAERNPHDYIGRLALERSGRVGEARALASAPPPPGEVLEVLRKFDR